MARRVSPPEQIAGRRIELCVGLLDVIDTPQAYEACLATLSLTERQRAARFVHRRHRREYVFAHGLLRFALSNFVPDIAPSAWSFATDRFGRPVIVPGATPETVHFSLSHTDGCVACVVSSHQAVGVDVERVSPRGDMREVARSVFSPGEIEALRELAPRDFVDCFFDYWTLKEAYIKARGRGLDLPLDQFSMLISGRQIGIAFGPGIADDPQRWHFTKSSPSPTHRLAIADGTGTVGGLPIMHRSWPLVRGASAA